MIDSLENTTDLTQVDSVNIGEHSIDNYLWLYMLCVLLVMIIIFLLARKKKPKKIRDIKQEVLSGEIDFKNIIDSSFNSQKLYDELKKKCHPDRFVGDSKQNEIANNLFQEITKNKNNVKALNELKQKAESELKITF